MNKLFIVSTLIIVFLSCNFFHKKPKNVDTDHMSYTVGTKPEFDIEQIGYTYSQLPVTNQNFNTLPNQKTTHYDSLLFKPLPGKPLIINGKFNGSVLRTANGCGVGNFIIPCMGDSALGIPPIIGSFYYTYSELKFRVLDTIPGSKILGLAFNKSKGWYPGNTSLIQPFEPYMVISDSGIFSYLIPVDYSLDDYDTIEKLYSIFIPGIVKVAKQITLEKTNPIVLLMKDNNGKFKLRFIDYPGLQERFNHDFHFIPEIFEVTKDNLFLSGRDTNGTYALYHFSTIQDTLYATYTLNDSVSNAQQMIKNGDSVFILSSPGDSIIILSILNLSDGSFTQTLIYGQSGARATYNEFKNRKYFTFQPISDTSGFLLQKQILTLNTDTLKLDTFFTNLEMDYFKNPADMYMGFGNFEVEWIGAKWNGGISDSVYLYSEYDTLKIKTWAYPNFINATWGCWVGIPKNELETIEFSLYPNPASSEVIIKLSGLEKGRQYKLDIINNSGQLQYSTNLKAYQKIQLPLQHFSKGIYMLILNTGRNQITKKLIIQ
jgi:Secretion system C-terminal sorting domain